MEEALFPFACVYPFTCKKVVISCPVLNPNILSASNCCKFIR